MSQEDRQIILQRIKIIEFFEEYGMEATKKAFNVGRSTIFLWKKKLREGGGRLSALKVGSRTPKTKRSREADILVIQFILNYRLEHPGVDKVTLKPIVDVFCINMGLKPISESTIGRIISDLKKQGKLPDYYIRTTLSGKTGKLIFKKRKKEAKKLRSRGYKPKEPGDLVQLDAIEIFLLGIKRYIITAIDVKSRFAFAYTYKTLSSSTAKDFMIKFQEVAPFPIRRVQTDNGKEFHRFFHQYLEGQNIIHFFNYPRSPKSNAYIERFNRTIQEQYIGWHLEELHEPDQFNPGLMEYLVWYNTEKIHRGLGKLSPLAYYVNNLPTKKSNMLWTATKV
jgi:transposase InsO family protein